MNLASGWLADLVTFHWLPHSLGSRHWSFWYSCKFKNTSIKTLHLLSSQTRIFIAWISAGLISFSSLLKCHFIGKDLHDHPQYFYFSFIIFIKICHNTTFMCLSWFPPLEYKLQEVKDLICFVYCWFLNF